MRAHGSVDAVPAAGPADHLCWVYEDDAAFDEAVREFLAVGLARGERLLCVGERVIDSLRAQGTRELSELVAAGTVETLTLAEAYEAAGPLLPERQLAFYDAATQRALGAGYRGLRVIAEVSDLAADPAQHADLVRWEHVADAYAAQGPGFSAMCVYRADLGQDVLADVAAVHPLFRGPEWGASFRLFADGDRLVLAGTVDSFSSERLERVLAAPVTGDLVVLDVSALEFVDVGGCRVLARWAAALSDRSVSVHVTGASPLLRRLWRLLCFDRVAPLIFLEPTA